MHSSRLVDVNGILYSAANACPLSAVRLVLVPRDVRLDRVEAHEPGLADAVGPQVGVHAEVVQRAREDAVRPAVELEVGRADGEAGHCGHVGRSFWSWWFMVRGRPECPTGPVVRSATRRR